MNKLWKLVVVAVTNSLLEIFLILASFSAVYLTYDGSFFLPLNGSGAKKGLSVSMSNFSKGINLKVSCNSEEFLNVMIPLAEKKVLKLSNFLANSFYPVKQCINILRLKFLYLLNISSVSLSAFLEWTINGISNSIEALICSSILDIWSFLSLWL